LSLLLLLLQLLVVAGDLLLRVLWVCDDALADDHAHEEDANLLLILHFA
jgi:hypothetical protein